MKRDLFFSCLYSLKRFKRTSIRFEYVLEFVQYCNDHEIYPSGGALSENGEYQYLYLN